MPKRVPTPPPGDDEPRYLTVVYPYAISGTCNMELPKDRQDFARWVACCIDKDAFFAIFHKPSSRAMVIIEVSRDYPHLDRVLGEHRWSEFLQKPTEEEMGKKTQVFFCTYSTGRIVQKNGWKRIDVDEVWFKGWSPRNRQITFPYPETHFCDVPVEDRTNLSMCRPLPGAVIPPPPVVDAPQPVVGSAAWIESKDGSSYPTSIPKQTKPHPLGVWGKGAPKPQTTSARPNPTAGGSMKKVSVVSQGSLTGARLPAVGGGSIAVKSSNVWQNTDRKPPAAMVATNWEDSPPVSGRNTPALRAVSPSIAPRKNAWETPSAQGGPDRAGNISAASWDSAGASTSSPDSDSGPDLTTATESDNPYAVHIHFSESMEGEFHGMGIRAMDDDNDGELGGLDVMAPWNTWDEPNGAATWDATPANWDDSGPLDAEDLWRQNTEVPKPMLCAAHGVICKKGICAEYAKQLRAAKREQEAEERKNAAENKGKKGKGRGAGKRNEKNESSRNVAQNNNANANPFRGPGAPVKTNWRGAPRAIVTADAVEKLEATKAASDGGWGNSDSGGGPDAATIASANAADAASAVSWGVSENAYDPWAEPATTTVTTAANRPSGGGKAPGKKKPGQTNPSTSWADQVEAELPEGDANFTTVTSKRGSRHGRGSSTSWRTSAKSSSSGWGAVPDMPW